MPATSRIVWPEKSLAQLVGVKLEEPPHANGNGKQEKKGLILDPSLFWNSTLHNPYLDDPALYREIRGLAAYKLSALAYACMSYRATKLIEAPLWVSEEIDGEEQWVDPKNVDPDLVRLLDEPNPDMTMDELLEIVSLYMDGTGKALLVKNRDKGKRVASLTPFAGDEFTVEQADGLMFGKFTVWTSKGNKVYGPDDVIFWKNADARNANDGLGPLEVALSSVNIDDEMRRTVQALLRNKMRPGAIALFPNGLSDPAMAERVKAEARANFAGASNAGKFMALEGTDKPLQFLENSLKDLALGPVSENVEAAVCSCFKVHPAVVGALIGIKNSSSFADTIKPATDLFYDIYVIPTWSRFEKKLTSKLLREWDDNPLRFIRFVKDEVRNLQADMGKRTSEAANTVGFWTTGERRQHTGKPLFGDDRDNDLGGSKQPAPVPIPEKRRTSRIQHKRDARQRLWAKTDIKARRDEPKYEAAAQAQFEKEKAEVVKRLEGTTDATLQAALLKLKNAYTRKDGEYHLQWVERYLKLIETTFDVAGADLGAELGFDFDLTNPRVQGAIKRRTNKLAGEVSDTTYGKIQDAVNEGGGTSAIAKRIRDDVFGGEITKARALTIARTESIGALNEAEMIAARESGIITSKEWLATDDARTRDSHHEINGQRVDLEEPFGNGLMHPGDRNGTAEEVINCRCSLLYHDEAA